MSISNYEEAQVGMSKLLPSLVEDGIVRTCINCEFFKVHAGQGKCHQVTPPASPPPKVIFYGCPFWELDIPF